MKKFIKNSILLFSLILILSCSKTTDTVEDNGLFYDVVYQTIATRENSKLGWVGVQGIMQMKISQNTETQGTFIFFYQNYKEPQFVYNTCSGGFKGNFVIPDSTITDPTSSTYDIFTPYVPDSGSTTPTSDTETSSTGEEVSLIQAYTFELAINFRSLDAACRTESNRVIGLSRFSNGEIIVKNEYRDILMKPVLTSDSQIQ